MIDSIITACILLFSAYMLGQSLLSFWRSRYPNAALVAIVWRWDMHNDCPTADDGELVHGTYDPHRCYVLVKKLGPIRVLIVKRPEYQLHQPPP